ncbi:MAG: hypothetical protein HY317_03155 [Acidobacteria bacterium]|nr:hypothetical protein [Acidobacteriota bacterium]
MAKTGKGTRRRPTEERKAALLTLAKCEAAAADLRQILGEGRTMARTDSMVSHSVAAERDREATEAEAFLRRRQPMDGLEALGRREQECRREILRELEGLVEAMRDPKADAWARQVEGTGEGGDGLMSREEALRWQLFQKGPRGWWVKLDAEGQRILKSYARTLTARTLTPWSMAAVAQLVANAASARLVADFAGVVRRAQSWPLASGRRPGWEVFIEHRLGSDMSTMLWDSKPYVSPSDVVNVFLRDRPFMAKLIREVPGRSQARRESTRRRQVATAGGGR